MLKKKTNSQTKKLNVIYETYQLSQLITEATRITPASKSLIDHLITSATDKINSSGVIHLGLSNHSLIYGKRKINPPMGNRDSTKIIELRNMKRFNKQDFVEDLFAQSWEQIVQCTDNDKMWTLWK